MMLGLSNRSHHVPRTTVTLLPSHCRPSGLRPQCRLMASFFTTYITSQQAILIVTSISCLRDAGIFAVGPNPWLKDLLLDSESASAWLPYSYSPAHILISCLPTCYVGRLLPSTPFFPMSPPLSSIFHNHCSLAPPCPVTSVLNGTG
jgi:hypothetical protein